MEIYCLWPRHLRLPFVAAPGCRPESFGALVVVKMMMGVVMPSTRLLDHASGDRTSEQDQQNECENASHAPLLILSIRRTTVAILRVSFVVEAAFFPTAVVAPVMTGFQR
jgi:hypothetical protein